MSQVTIAQSEQGFTLIELLVCTSIIGILAAIAFPAFSNYRSNAYNSSAASDVRNLGLAVLGVSDAGNLSDCTDASCETSYRGFAKSPCSRIMTSATAGDENSSVVIGCCLGGNMGYMFSAISGTTVAFPLSTGNCATTSL